MILFRTAFDEDFAAQTSDEVEVELDRHQDPITTKFLKGTWGERMTYELAETNNWDIISNSISLSKASL